jgi:hypothetical protein
MESIQYKFDSNRPWLLVIKRKKMVFLTQNDGGFWGETPQATPVHNIFNLRDTEVVICIIPVLLKGIDCLNRY